MAVIDLESGIIGEFVKAGLVPDECVRIIIDIPHDKKARMYYEVFADGEKLKRIDLAGLLKDGVAIPASVPAAGEIPREAGVNPPEPEGSRPEPTSAPPPPPSPPNETMTRGDPPPPKGE